MNDLQTEDRLLVTLYLSQFGERRAGSGDIRELASQHDLSDFEAGRCLKLLCDRGHVVPKGEQAYRITLEGAETVESYGWVPADLIEKHQRFRAIFLSTLLQHYNEAGPLQSRVWREVLNQNALTLEDYQRNHLLMAAAGLFEPGPHASVRLSTLGAEVARALPRTG